MKNSTWNWFVALFLTMTNGMLLLCYLVSGADISFSKIINLLFFIYGIYKLSDMICITIKEMRNGQTN